MPDQRQRDPERAVVTIELTDREDLLQPGFPKAQVMLGVLYSRGYSGLLKDLVRAHMWLSLGAKGATDEKTNETQSLLREVEGQLTPAQREQSLQLQREWSEQHHP